MDINDLRATAKPPAGKRSRQQGEKRTGTRVCAVYSFASQIRSGINMHFKEIIETPAKTMIDSVTHIHFAAFRVNLKMPRCDS